MHVSTRSTSSENLLRYLTEDSFGGTQGRVFFTGLAEAKSTSGTMSKMRWGDSLDDDDETLPPPSVSGPDKNGIKHITEYKKNDKGETIKTVSKVKVVKVEKKIYQVWFSTPCTPNLQQAQTGARVHGWSVAAAFAWQISPVLSALSCALLAG